MICSSVKRFFMSNLLRGGYWTLKAGATQSGGTSVIEPDEMFSSVLQSVIEAKYDKASMQSTFQNKGAGILLVGIFTPFASAADIAKSEAKKTSELVAKKSVKVFDNIYVYDGIGQRSFHTIYSEAT
jgi:hypothetical protein